MTFQGQWICTEEFAHHPLRDVMGPQETLPPHDEALQHVHMLVRRDMEVVNPSAYGKITIRITADDYYKLYINGAYVGQGPTCGYYDAFYYNEYNLTPYIKPGKNTIFVDVYYQGLINRVWISGDYRMGLIADIYGDDTLLLATDSTWEYAIDPSYVGRRLTGYETQFLEDVDSRRRPTDWRPAVAIPTPYTFAGGPTTPVAVYDRLPVETRKTAEGWWFDFGTELTGGLKLTAVGHGGDTLRLLCGEECTADGRVRYQMRCNCDYEEFWTLDEGENTLCQYEYKAFRYAEIIPVDGAAVDVAAVAAQVRHYPMEDAACTLTSDDAVLEQVFALCKNGVRYGSQENFVDCPSREKGQYAGDLTITGASQLLLTGDPALLRRAIENQARSMALAPGMLAVFPCALQQQVADYSLQFPLLVQRYYAYTGDAAFVREMLPVCERLLTYYRRFARPDGLVEGMVDQWNLVDWPENWRDNYDFPLTIPIGPGCHNVLNAFYVGCVKTVEELKTALGLPTNGESERLTAAFNACFLRRDTGVYVDSEGSSHSSLHANVIPAFYGLLPAGGEQPVAALLLDKGICCGVYMTYFLLKALTRLGRPDAVYDLITSKGPNSWYNMVQEGGTTCFEAWGKEQKWNTSLCHPWASAPIPVLVEDLIGLQVDGTGKQVRVAPRLPADVTLSMRIPLPWTAVRFTYNKGKYTWEKE